MDAFRPARVFLIVHLTHSPSPTPCPSRWREGAASSCTPAWPWMAAAPVKAPESLAESQMRQLDNQEGFCRLRRLGLGCCHPSGLDGHRPSAPMSSADRLPIIITGGHALGKSR